jgi:ABC-2 type transport system permease protein
MMTPALTIARVTFLESVRQPIYLIMILLCGLLMFLTGATAAYSMGYTETGEVYGDNKVLLDLGLATVLFCGTLLSGFIATAAVSREIENKTVLTVVSKPVPRAAVVLGKYVGGAGAVLVGVVIMATFLQMAVRHGVLSNVADPIDQPVLTFGFLALVAALLLGAWGNFFYGWHFCQTATLAMLPLVVGAYVLALNFKKDTWEVQAITTDLKPQVLTATFCVVLSQLVLTAIAVAASTRLGQVMTIVTCFAVFVGGLLSSYFVGRHAFDNDPVGLVVQANPEIERMRPMTALGDTWNLSLKSPPSATIEPGATLYYGPTPNGVGLASGNGPAWDGQIADEATWLKPERVPGIVVTKVERLGMDLEVRNLGGRPAAIARPPVPGDYLFLRPTRVNALALAAWGVVPNMQFFWLTDAVTQNHPVPLGHVVLVVLYAVCHVVAFLALAVALFQRREVG